MNLKGLIPLVLCALFSAVPTLAAEDFLTTQEVDAVRDAQDPPKRIVLYLDFAQRRLDAVRTNLASRKSDFGKAVQKNLREYALILEALDTAIEDARERRVPLDKPLAEVERRGGEFLKFLQGLRAKSSPGWSDYRFTLEEAVAMTEDEIADARKGSFPEVQEREPPRLPAAPPKR
ncbi:MAG: hypothetical protein HY648_01140 [Acidobacteria bacterium]|nr:hypothetical protein [Acidobacteriota bacterium]